MKAAVLGCGAWGTTLAKILAENGHSTKLWCHDPAIAAKIQSEGRNADLLPDIQLPSASGGLESGTGLDWACGEADVMVMATASQYFSSLAEKAIPLMPDGALVVSATKGIDEKQLKRPSEILRELLPAPRHGQIAVLSGPNISSEIARGKVAATVISSANAATAEFLQQCFTTDTLRVYTNSDVAGTELGGTLKNIFAIAAGVVDGLDLGNNAKSALMVRGLVEMCRFAACYGADPQTLYGLAGLGDLITTCSSTLSRNHFVGEQLGRGRRLPDILSEMKAVAEGVNTTKHIREMARMKKVDMPMTEEMYQVLFQGKPVTDAIDSLLSRKLKAE